MEKRSATVKKTAIVVDSTASLKKELADLDNVFIVPLTLTYEDGEVFTDSSEDEVGAYFYESLKSQSTPPKTSQPNPQCFIDIFDRLKEENYDEAYVITLSASLSGTFQTAKLIADKYQDSVHIEMIDSKRTSYIIEGLVEYILKWTAEGVSREKIVENVEWLIDESQIYVLIEDFDQLYKGGRVSALSGILGSTLRIRPILYFDDQGTVSLATKIRTDKRANKYMLSLVDDAMEKYPAGMQLYFAHGEAQDKLGTMLEQVEGKYPDVPVRYGYLTPVLGTHGGRGCLGIGYLPYIENKPN